MPPFSVGGMLMAPCAMGRRPVVYLSAGGMSARRSAQPPGEERVVQVY